MVVESTDQFEFNDWLSLPFIHPEDILKRLGERIHGGARQHA